MLGESERIFRVTPSPPLADDQVGKLDGLVAALERCIAKNQAHVGEGPWEVEGSWDTETLEGFERSCEQRWGIEHDLDTGVIQLWGDPSRLHGSLGENLLALLLTRIGDAVRELQLEEGVKEALANDILLSVRH
jgi:hypothetical protein